MLNIILCSDLKFSNILKKNIEEQIKQEEQQNAVKLPELSKEVQEKLTTMFDGLSIDDAKKIIFEVTQEMVADLKVRIKFKQKLSFYL